MFVAIYFVQPVSVGLRIIFVVANHYHFYFLLIYLTVDDFDVISFFFRNVNHSGASIQSKTKAREYVNFTFKEMRSEIIDIGWEKSAFWIHWMQSNRSNINGMVLRIIFLGCCCCRSVLNIFILVCVCIMLCVGLARSIVWL